MIWISYGTWEYFKRKPFLVRDGPAPGRWRKITRTQSYLKPSESENVPSLTVPVRVPSRSKNWTRFLLFVFFLLLKLASKPIRMVPDSPSVAYLEITNRQIFRRKILSKTNQWLSVITQNRQSKNWHNSGNSWGIKMCQFLDHDCTHWILRLKFFVCLD